MTSHNTHFNRMSCAIARAQDRFGRSYDKADDRAVLVTMFRELMNDCSRLIEDATGETDMLNGSFESVKDDIDDAFFNAVQAEEQAAEDRRDPTLRAASLSDGARA